MATVAEYNRAQASGQDALGRKYMPRPLVKPPFYAIQLQSWNLTSYAAWRWMARYGSFARMARRSATCMPRASCSGWVSSWADRSAGGMSVTPALALGRLLGHEILSFET